MLGLAYIGGFTWPLQRAVALRNSLPGPPSSWRARSPLPRCPVLGFWYKQSMSGGDATKNGRVCRSRREADVSRPHAIHRTQGYLRHAATFHLRNPSGVNCATFHVRKAAPRGTRRTSGIREIASKNENPQEIASSGLTHHVNVIFNGRNDTRVIGTLSKSPTLSWRPPIRTRNPQTTTQSGFACFGKTSLGLLLRQLDAIGFLKSAS